VHGLDCRGVDRKGPVRIELPEVDGLIAAPHQLGDDRVAAARRIAPPARSVTSTSSPIATDKRGETAIHRPGRNRGHIDRATIVIAKAWGSLARLAGRGNRSRI